MNWPQLFAPLFLHEDWEQVVDAMPTFDGRGLVLAVPPVAQGATAPVEVASILRTLLDDEEADATREEEDPPAIPKDRSALISRGAASAQVPPEAASSASVAPSSAPEHLEATPRTKRLSGFKLGKTSVTHAAIDQLPLAAKKKKGDIVTPSGADSSAAAAPSSVGKGGDDAHASPARSSSRGLEERPGGVPAPAALQAPEVPVPDADAKVPKAQEPPVSQAIVTLPPPAPAPLVPGSSASSPVLDRALSELGQLRAAAASEEEKQAATQAAAARETALKDTAVAQDRCKALEAKLQGLRDELAKEARDRQAKEE
nr:MAP7 domain-containing protein 1-like [Aegilops tauschii subsp. strangulata]